MNLFALLSSAPLFSQEPLAIVVDVVVFIAVVVVVSAVIADFSSYHHQSREVRRSGRSFVETGSMSAFFVVYYLVVRLRVFELALSGTPRVILIVAGLALMVFGAGFNIYGRAALKANWANQIKIYEGHTLVTGGPYALVRHPLYASLIWMALAGSVIYANALALALTFGVFVPMMYVRARKEEALLLEAFGERYARYRAQTGMFFPALPKRDVEPRGQ